MSDKMTDAQVRADLERIDPGLAKQWDGGHSYALRLLAESQQALGRIEKKRPHRYHEKTVNLFRDCPQCEAMIGIARNAVKGGSNG